MITGRWWGFGVRRGCLRCSFGDGMLIADCSTLGRNWRTLIKSSLVIFCCPKSFERPSGVDCGGTFNIPNFKRRASNVPFDSDFDAVLASAAFGSGTSSAFGAGASDLGAGAGVLACTGGVVAASEAIFRSLAFWKIMCEEKPRRGSRFLYPIVARW